jgi:hypothetical protein
VSDLRLRRRRTARHTLSHTAPLWCRWPHSSSRIRDGRSRSDIGARGRDRRQKHSSRTGCWSYRPSRQSCRRCPSSSRRGRRFPHSRCRPPRSHWRSGPYLRRCLHKPRRRPTPRLLPPPADAPWVEHYHCHRLLFELLFGLVRNGPAGIYRGLVQYFRGHVAKRLAERGVRPRTLLTTRSRISEGKRYTGMALGPSTNGIRRPALMDD